MKTTRKLVKKRNYKIINRYYALVAGAMALVCLNSTAFAKTEEPKMVKVEIEKIEDITYLDEPAQQEVSEIAAPEETEMPEEQPQEHEEEPEVEPQQTTPENTSRGLQEGITSVPLYTELEVIALAQTLQQEAGGIKSMTEKSAVIWTVLNRVDSGRYSPSIMGVLTQPNQFAYKPWKKYSPETYALVVDVLERWQREKNGEEVVGRTLPREYMYFFGKNRHNYFSIELNGEIYKFDFNTTPYEN